MVELSGPSSLYLTEKFVPTHMFTSVKGSVVTIYLASPGKAWLTMVKPGHILILHTRCFNGHIAPILLQQQEAPSWENSWKERNYHSSNATFICWGYIWFFKFWEIMEIQILVQHTSNRLYTSLFLHEKGKITQRW